MKYLLNIIFLFSACGAMAQDWASYNSFYSSGSIPQDFTDNYTRKYEQMKQSISQDQHHKQKKREDDFYRKTEFFLDNFLIGGDVTFGDSISIYCERVLDLLLKDRPELRKKLRVYTVKSPEFNAFATATGIIFVNVGLLAEIENEAQLALVLAHEVIHFDENHVLTQYIEGERISRGEDMYRKNSHDKRLQALSQYSRQQEIDADQRGFNQFYKPAGYDTREAVYLMDIMQYSYLPFDMIPFDKSHVEAGGFLIPDAYLLKEVAAITADGDYDDSKSSHPNIKSRREKMNELVAEESGRQYIVSESTFNYCQRLARYESCRLQLVRKNYPEAIYLSFLLSKTYGSDKFQKTIVAKAIQGSSVYRNFDYLKNEIPNHKDIEGESQQVYHIWRKFKKEDLNTLAVAYAYNLHKEYPDDVDIELTYRHALYDLVFHNELKYSDFFKPQKESGTFLDSANLYATEIDTLNPENQTEKLRTRNSKLTRIKEKVESASETIAESDDPEFDYNYFKTAFLPFASDSVFISDIQNVEKRFAKEGKNFFFKGESNTTGFSRFEKSVALGIDSILMINPVYLALDDRNKTEIKFVQSQNQLANYNVLIGEISGNIGLHIDAMDFKLIGKDEVDRFNDLSLLNNWITERIDHRNTGARLTDHIPAQQIKEQYGINYVAYTGNITMRSRPEYNENTLYLGLLIWPLLPFSLAESVGPNFDSYNFFFLFDLRTGDALLAEFNYYNTRDRDDYLKSIIYNNLIQIKSISTK